MKCSNRILFRDSRRSWQLIACNSVVAITFERLRMFSLVVVMSVLGIGKYIILQLCFNLFMFNFSRLGYLKTYWPFSAPYIMPGPTTIFNSFRFILTKTSVTQRCPHCIHLVWYFTIKVPPFHSQ